MLLHWRRKKIFRIYFFNFPLYIDELVEENDSVSAEYFDGGVKIKVSVQIDREILNSQKEKIEELINLMKKRDHYNMMIMTWIGEYFGKSGNLNIYISFKELYENFKKEIEVPYTMAQFKRNIRMWVLLSPHIDCVNPKELCNVKGRILGRDGSKTVEYIYMKSKGVPVQEKKQ